MAAVETDVTSRPETVSVAALSQWELIRRRFSAHRPAVWSFRILVVLYLVAGFCEFFAPFSTQYRNADFPFCPPMLPRYSWSEGWVVDKLIPHQHPLDLSRYYVRDRDVSVPLGWFVAGDAYRLVGVIPLEVHLFGIDWKEVDRKGISRDEVVFFLLGSDGFGHDSLSRILFGARVSLSVGLIAIGISSLLGIVLGGISGYVGGKTDNLIQRSIEIVNSFPDLPLWLAIAAIIPADWPALWVYFAITIVLSLLGWTGLARVVRGRILSLREEDYAVAARLMGAGHTRILFRHLVPGFTSHIVVALTMKVPAMILGETGLSFLGLGLRPPVVSWGVMLQACTNLQILANYPWLLMPVVMVVITVLAFNFLGDGLRDAADPYA